MPLSKEWLDKLEEAKKEHEEHPFPSNTRTFLLQTIEMLQAENAELAERINGLLQNLGLPKVNTNIQEWK